MALVGQPVMLCHDDGVPPFMDAGGLAFGYGYDHHYQPFLLEEECLLGSHAWELPTGVLGAEPGNASAFGGHDLGWTHHATGVSSPVSMLSFDDPPASATSASQKRPRALAQAQQGPEQESTTDPKRQCGGDRKAAIKPRKTSASANPPPKEPQSDAAKNRRERIGERLRALQELVPNGSKVDMVTMLDKAITYVKFMQLQLTVLETDAFWPAQGGEAPEISQVKAALDAIMLSSSQQNHQWI
ncbi:hypothetical protein ACQ4PT_015737 [Festuca glaucescens]